MTDSPSTVEFIVDQQIRQVQNVQALQPINGPQVVGVDGSRTPPQVSTMVSPMDGELPRPSTVGADFYRKAREIRRDPTIRMVRELSMAPLLMAEWEYDAADDAPAGAKDLVESIMTQMRLPLLRTSLCGMIDYGWQPYEVIAEQRDDGVSAPRLKPLLQDLTHILVNAADGSFFGLRQTPTVGTRIGWVYLLDQQCLVISQDVEGTNWYGEPTLRSLEKTYDESEVVNKSSRKYDAKIAGTHWVIYYPLGTSDYGGQTLDNGEIARKLLQQAEAVGGIAVPRSVVNMLDSMNAAAAGNEASQWKIELLSDSGKGQQPFTDRQKYLDVLKVRAFGFPERSILEGQFGTKAEAEAHADIAVSNLEVRHAFVCLQYSLKIVDLILAWNYGQQAKGKVWIKPSPIADDKKGFFRQLYLALIANPQGFMTEMSAVDLTQLRDRLGLPEFAMPAGASDPWASMIDPVTGQLLMPPSTTTPDPAALPGSPAGFALDHTSSNGRWVTNEDGVHIFINSDGEVRRPSGKESSKKKADDSAKSDVLKRHAAIQDAAAKKRNAKFASLPGNDEHRKAQEQGQKSDGRVAYNTPTEKALTSGNFQYRGLITVGADAEGRLREFATYERPGIPGSILVRPDGAWQHFDGNGYGVAGTSEVDMAAFIKHMSRPGVSMSLADEIDDAAFRAKKPTEAQREAGNYRKGHVTIHGLRIAIETPRGEKRKKKWPKLPAHYGYFKGSVGADGDQVDVFVGPKPGTEVAFVANMKGDDGRFDEHKVLIGFKSIDKAKACLAEAYGDDLKRIGKLTPMTIPTLKEWLSRPATVALSYNPDQPRAAAGSRDGGRWTKVTAVAKRFGIPAQTVHDILTTPADELARRDKYMAPSSGRDDAVGPTLDYEKHPLGTAKIDSSRHATGETDNAYVDYLREFDPHELKTSEHEDGISKSGSVAKYVEWAKAGHQAPPISVFDSSNGNGDLVSTNRRRVLAAREAGTKLVGWHGVNNKETGLPLRYGDVKKAAAELGVK